jgi:hypothetical protein
MHEPRYIIPIRTRWSLYEAMILILALTFLVGVITTDPTPKQEYVYLPIDGDQHKITWCPEGYANPEAVDADQYRCELVKTGGR